MDPALAEAALRERLGPGLDQRLAEVDAEFGGLLERPARLLLLADEEGLLLASPAPEAAGGGGLDLEGVLERLTPTRTFRRPDGTVGFVCDLELRTPRGPVRAVLWDEAVRQAQGLEGRRVRVTGLAERPRAGGRELHSTRRTQVGALD